jgi:crotonobetainyl-CoA:carnitine CoA-transferase CaiB-like acyl-CoA transferase
VVLDLDDPADHDAFENLVAGADILVESFDPGVMAAKGLGQEQLRARNPRLIYISVTPYGQDGPDAQSPATDLTLEAAGGLISLQGDGDRPPIPVGYPQASFHGGTQAATDAIIALNERAASGVGQYLDVSLQAGIVWTLMNASGYPANVGANPPGTCETRDKGAPDLVPGVKLGNVYACKDGHVLAALGLAERGARMLATILGYAEEEGMLPGHLKRVNWALWQAELSEGRIDLAPPRNTSFRRRKGS